MTYNVEISPEAEQDSQEIIKYKSEYDPLSAIVFVDKIIGRFIKILSIFPKSGVVFKKSKNIRKISLDDYTAFYVFSEDNGTIYIIRIIDQGKPLEARGIEF